MTTRRILKLLLLPFAFLLEMTLLFTYGVLSLVHKPAARGIRTLAQKLPEDHWYFN